MAAMKRKLGSWFPKASQMKGLKYEEGQEISLLLFYHYVNPQWSESQKQRAVEFVENQCSTLMLGGRTRIACEGMNCTISGTAASVRAFARNLVESLDKDFLKCDFKYVDNLTIDRAFKDLKVLPVKELVYYGMDNQHTLGEGGVHLDPKDYHKKLGEDDTVVIDVRNGYEYDIGRFEGQEKAGGAELLNPEMRKSTDFPDWINKEETKKKLEGKQVLMYCTGGVRCERASALLQREYGDKLKGVYQLQGGIERYMQEFSESGGYWRGKNFVFDKREAFDITNKQGVGGVLQTNQKVKKQKKSKSPTAGSSSSDDSKEEKQEPGLLGKCCFCHAPWDRYIGKRKCKTCEVPVLVCEACLTKGVGKGDDQETVMKVRCPLCVKDGCTVPAAKLAMTDNGRRSDAADTTGEVAARTVLKWGGGKGKKSAKRSAEKEAPRNLSNIPCKFGVECQRKDCWFWHPKIIA